MVIIGGGLAAWMAAAFLARRLEALGPAITVVDDTDDGSESENAIGPGVHAFHAAIGLDTAAFRREAAAVPHLGTRHDGWFWPCGAFGADLDGIAFHHHWLRLLSLGGSPDLDRFSLEAMAAREGVFGGVPGRPLTFGFTFDADTHRALLQRVALEAGVTRGVSGPADLVIDCSRTDAPGIWHGQTVALGGAASILPRLDQVIFTLERLVALWPRPDIAPAAVAHFNADMAAAHQEVRDITAARQVLSGRSDAASDSLAQRIALFEATGEIVAAPPGPVRLADWQAVFLGLGLRPRALHPAVELVPEDDFKRRMARLRTHIQDTVNSLPAFGG